MNQRKHRKVLAANMWSIWNFGNPSERYNNFLKRGRPEFTSFIEQVLLNDEVVVPTQDFLSLTILIGVLGEKAVLDLLASNSLKFVRLKGAFAYIGNGVGIKSIEISRGENNTQNSMCGNMESTINWAIKGLNEKPKDTHLYKKILDNSMEIDGKTISDEIESETYQDVITNEKLQNFFALRNKDLNHLNGIEEKGVRIYGGKDSDTWKGDEIDTYLLLNNTNIEIKLTQLCGCTDMLTSNPIGHLLKAKFEKENYKSQNAITILRQIANIPDFGEAILKNTIRVKDILRIKESKKGENFRTWFHENCQGNESEIAKEYIKLIEETPFMSTMPIKILRFLLTAGIGYFPKVGEPLSIGVGILDTFFIDKWLRGNSPKFFISDLKQILDK